jgi:rubrerythrin
MKNDVEIGMNKTGVGTSPIDAPQTIAEAERTNPTAPGDDRMIMGVRAAYHRDAEPLGTVPPPPTVKGMAKAAIDKLKGGHPTVLVDKLGERLAFERTGTRLYDALLTKFDLDGTWTGGPSRVDLLKIRNEELHHFEMLRVAIEGLGADPTAITPSADVTAIESLGLIQVVTEPRTSLAQGLHAMLIAELADNDGWELLITIAREMGKTELVRQFEVARQEEAQHLLMVRGWLLSHARVSATTKAS